MKVKLLSVKGTWRQIADSARTTIHMEEGDKEVSSNYKRRLLLSEHSPIRKLLISWKWYDLKYWVSVHLVRHKFGIEHWVRTQRTDRTGVNRDDLSQGNLVEHECEANAQTIINISRKRLCKQASKETTEAWKKFLENVVKPNEPELFNVCRKDCVYRGHCYEYKSCGYHKTEEFQQELKEYRQGVNE